MVINSQPLVVVVIFFARRGQHMTRGGRGIFPGPICRFYDAPRRDRGPKRALSALQGVSGSRTCRPLFLHVNGVLRPDDRRD